MPLREVLGQFPVSSPQSSPEEELSRSARTHARMRSPREAWAEHRALPTGFCTSFVTVKCNGTFEYFLVCVTAMKSA